MSSSTPKKPLSSNTMSTGSSRKPTTSSSPTPRAPPSGSVLSSNGVARTASHKASPSVSRPARPSARRPGSIAGSSSNLSTAGNDDSGKEEDARAEKAALIDSLKKNVRDAELVSEEYQHQLNSVQQRLDELMQEHAKLEERYHESTEKTEELQVQARESSRHVREMETIYESERVAMMKDREEALDKESELKKTIQRLKETMAGKEARLQDSERPALRKGRSSGRSSPTDETAQFAPSSTSGQRSDSKGTSRLVMQKDQIIESLRLELAEAQIKLVEVENMGGGRLQELERTLLEARMTNARLMEDNESFQLLLGERTLNGDFQKGDLMQAPGNDSSKLGSLAEELESAEGETDKSDNYRRVEAEAKSLRDQNKALTLYIEKIISRVLQHENFETILDQKPEGLGALFGSGSSDKQEKDLPPPPPVEKDDSTQSSFLGRAMSVARRQRPASQMFTAPSSHNDELTAGHRARPQSQIAMPPPEHVPSANEDPATAPSIPLGRATSVSTRGKGHRRTQSEVSTELPGAAAVINQMYRGPSKDAGPISPMSPGGSTPRSQYFGPSALTGSSSNSASGRPNSGSRAVSGLRAASGQGAASASESTISRESGDLPSPPRNSAGNTTYTGAVMTQNKLRPLRLVQNEEAQKKANRGSWMGWFNRGKDENAPRSVSGPPDADGSGA